MGPLCSGAAGSKATRPGAGLPLSRRVPAPQGASQMSRPLRGPKGKPEAHLLWWGSGEQAGGRGALGHRAELVSCTWESVPRAGPQWAPRAVSPLPPARERCAERPASGAFAVPSRSVTRAAREQEGHDHRGATAGGVAVSQACARPHGNGGGVLCPSLRTNPGRLGAGGSGGREPLLQPGPCRGQRGRACRLRPPGRPGRLDRSPPPCPLWPRAPTAPALGTCPEGLSPQEALLLRPGEQAGAGPPRSPRPTLLRAFRVGMTGPLGSVPGDKVLRGQSGLAAEAGGLTVLCGDRRL